MPTLVEEQPRRTSKRPVGSSEPAAGPEEEAGSQEEKRAQLLELLHEAVDQEGGGDKICMKDPTLSFPASMVRADDQKELAGLL